VLTSAAEPLLCVDHLESGYGKIRVLHGVELTVSAGEIVALLGPNGAGKTTLLRALSGLLPVSAGVVRFGGRDMRLTDVTTGTPAALASTGQQKALLIGVILAHAALIASTRGFAPLLLLDEPAVHLDAERRRALWDVLMSLPAQTVVTGTDADTFLPLADHAEALATGDGGLHPDGRFLRPETDTAPVAPRR